MNIIEVGDTIINCEGSAVSITAVEIGKYGMLLQGWFIKDNPSNDLLFEGYCPYELLPSDYTVFYWYGWYEYDYATLSNQKRIGLLGLTRLDLRCTVKEYDAEWKRTLETMRLEQMSGTHTLNNTLQSRPFTEQSRPDVL